jgi:hypothetical protein
MDVILVLGSVTSKQYQPIRLALLRKGSRPRVVRISDQFTNESDFIMQTDANPNYMQEFIKEAFGDDSPADIVAIVQEETPESTPDYDMPWEVRWNYVKTLAPEDTPSYVVENGLDGSSWLEGYGFERTAKLNRTRVNL